MSKSTDTELAEKMKIQLDKSKFNEWYNAVTDLADLTDKRYPVKGMNVWTPYGWRLMQNIDMLIHHEMVDTAHQEVCFPLLVPEEQFQREADHIKGFSDEVYWVSHAGGKDLDIPLLLRPTSETAMYPMFALWIRSHADLPLKSYQVINVYRHDTKQTRPFIRMREIHFFEAHTCHIDFEDAERQIDEDLAIMRRLCHALCIPYLVLKRPDWDKFPGAYYSLACDAMMPGDRTLQIGTIHQYRDNFAKAYEIEYEDAEGEHQFAHQTTYGMSERLIGAIIGIHGDDRGLILPPDIAPYQAAIVPIPKKGKQALIASECEKLQTTLEEAGVRVHLDERDIRPGSKFYDWELKGVPLRIELGPRDLANDAVMLVRRDTGKKEVVDRNAVVAEVRERFDQIADNLRSQAETRLEESIHTVHHFEDAMEADGIVRVAWCGNEECGLLIQDDIDKSMLGTKRDVDASEDPFEGNCLNCGKPTTTAAYFARTY